MSQIRWLVCTLLLVATALAQAPEGKLKMAVIVTRHGVRPPLSPDTTSPYAKDPWPSLSQWGARCPGDLTQAGFKLVTLMGAYYREYYADSQRGLLPAGCPSQKVHIWADNEERTMKTSEALAQGLAQPFPGCSVNVNYYNRLKDSTTADPCASPYETDLFFHPLSSKTLKSRIDPAKMKVLADTITEAAPGMVFQFRESLTAIQNVVECCDPKECTSPGACTLLTLPDKVKLDDNTLKWTGPFSVGSTATENLLLEYANGMSCSTTGWGRVTYDYTKPDCKPSGGELFKKMQEIHTAYFWVLNRTRVDGTPYLATLQGSNLANQILVKLEDGVAGPVAAPLVIYGGHDTNIANIAGMLDIRWSLDDLPENDTPPAGALVFELYERAPRDFYVMLRYVHARMDQLRTQDVLSLSNGPQWSPVTLRGCDDRCPYAKFRAIMSGAIDKRFTTTLPGD